MNQQESAVFVIFHGLSEIVARLPILRFTAKRMDQVAADEDEHIEQTKEDRHAGGRAAHNELAQINDDVHQRDILHLDGQNAKEQDLLVRIQCGVGEEEREVEVAVARLSRNQAGDGCGDHSDQIKKIKANLAPAILKPKAEHIVKVKRKQEEEWRRRRGREDEGHQPPDLSAQKPRARKRDQPVELQAEGRPDVHEQKHDALPENDILHQITDGIAAQFALKIEVESFFHTNTLLIENGKLCKKRVADALRQKFSETNDSRLATV